MIVTTEPSPATVPGRVAFQAERRLERRRRQLLAFAGTLVLVVLLAITVLVVVMVR